MSSLKLLRPTNDRFKANFRKSQISTSDFFDFDRARGARCFTWRRRHSVEYENERSIFMALIKASCCGARGCDKRLQSACQTICYMATQSRAQQFKIAGYSSDKFKNFSRLPDTTLELCSTRHAWSVIPPLCLELNCLLFRCSSSIFA